MGKRKGWGKKKDGKDPFRELPFVKRQGDENVKDEKRQADGKTCKGGRTKRAMNRHNSLKACGELEMTEDREEEKKEGGRRQAMRGKRVVRSARPEPQAEEN